MSRGGNTGFARWLWPGTVVCALAAGLCGLGTAAGPAAAEEPTITKAAPEIHLNNGLLTVRAKGVPLIDVLRAVAEAADIDPWFRGDLGAPVNLSFGPLPLDQGIRRLTGDHTVLMVRDAGANPAGPPRLTELHVFGPATIDAERNPSASKADLLAWITRDLGGANPAHRRVAMERLSGLEPAVALDILGTILTDDPARPLRIRAVTILDGMGGDGATERLQRVLGDNDAAVRAKVVRTLGTTAGQRAMLALGQVVFGDYDAAMRRAAVESLDARSEVAASAFLAAAAEDADPEVSQAAREALARR